MSESGHKETPPKSPRRDKSPRSPRTPEGGQKKSIDIESVYGTPNPETHETVSLQKGVAVEVTQSRKRPDTDDARELEARVKENLEAEEEKRRKVDKDKNELLQAQSRLLQGEVEEKNLMKAEHEKTIQMLRTSNFELTKNLAKMLICKTCALTNFDLHNFCPDSR